MKKVFWILVGGLLLAGALWFWREQRDLTTRTRIPLGALQSPQAAAQALSQELRTEFQSRPLLILGLWPDDSFALQMGHALIEAASPLEAQNFAEIWVDEELQSVFTGRKVFLRGQAQGLQSEVAEFLKSGRRLLILTSPVFASSFLENSPAWQLRQKADLPDGFNFISLIFSDFPRRREDEAQMRLPCVLPHADQVGTGAFGCRLQQLARLQYRKNFPACTQLGQLEQLNSRDFLFAIGTQP